MAIACCVALAAVLAQVEVARGQACCTATSDADFGQVGPCRDASLAAQVGYQRSVGTYDERGDYRALGGDVDDVTMLLGGGVRFVDRRLQVFGVVPMRLQHRNFEAAASSWGAGVGDAAVGFGATVIEGAQLGMDADDSSSFVPYVDVILSQKVPTGRAPAESQDSAAADVTGDGVWESTAAVRVTSFVTLEHAFTLTGAYGLRAPRTVDGRTIDAGDALSVRLGWVYVPDMFWSLGVTLRARATSSANEDGHQIPDSSSHVFGVGAYYTRALAFPDWDLTVSAATDAFWSGGGSGVPFSGPSMALSLRRNFQ